MEALRRPSTRVLYDNSVPFSTFVRLVCDVGNVKPRLSKSTARRDETGTAASAEAVLKAWIDDRRSAKESSGIVVLFFRLFFPDQSVRRR